MTMAIAIRYAHLEERDALEALQWRASLANPSERAVLLAHPDAIELPAGQITARQVLVAEIDGERAGFAVLLDRDGGEVELDGLFVEPALWRSGVGRALIEHCVGLARAQGASVMLVIGNQNARDFYRACGFALIGSHATRFGPALRLRRRL